jgi:hypothetical protein
MEGLAIVRNLETELGSTCRRDAGDPETDRANVDRLDHCACRGQRTRSRDLLAWRRPFGTRGQEKPYRTTPLVCRGRDHRSRARPCATDAGRGDRRRHRRCRDLRSADSALATGNTVEVSGIDHPQTATAIACGLQPRAPHGGHHLASRDCHRQALANQPPWHRVAVRVNLDGAIVGAGAGHLAQRSKRRMPAEGLLPMGLVTLEALPWRMNRSCSHCS